MVVGAGLRGNALVVQHAENKGFLRRRAGLLAVGGLPGVFGVNHAWYKANVERTVGRGAGG